MSLQSDPAEAALRTGIRHAEVRNRRLVIHPGESDKGRLSLSLPADPFTLTGHAKTDLSPWHFVNMWLQRLFREIGLVLIDHDHPLRELMLLADQREDFAFGLLFRTPPTAVRNVEYALYTNAKIMLFGSPEIEAQFSAKFIGPYQSGDLDDLTQALVEFDWPGQTRPPLVEPAPTLPLAQTAQMDSSRPIRLLIVSYFSGPCRIVGTQRVNYWFDEIAALSDHKIDVHIATAINWGEQSDRVHFVPDRGAASVFGGSPDLKQWAIEFIKTEQRNAHSASTLGYYWQIALEHYFASAELPNFDVVLISGNPFACFDFAAFAKHRWRARVILDYRDPFANNPRFNYSPRALQAARDLERGYNFQSDLCVTVNRDCIDLLEAREDVNVAIIPNGFDERVTAHIETETLPGNFINFVHAGTIYRWGSPAALVRALDPARHRLHHVGSTADLTTELLNSPCLVTHGRQRYEQTLSIIGGSDCGVVFVTESGFETGTKIFDYLAMGVDILLCTHGKLHKGTLHSMLGDRPGVYWCTNDEEHIGEFLKGYVPSSSRASREKAQFSRAHSTKLLIQHIMELVGR